MTAVRNVVEARPDEAATGVTRPGVPGHRPLAARILGGLGLLLVALLALELTCRVEEWVAYRVPIDSRITSLNDLLIHDQEGVHGRPNAQFQRWRMNSLGMRGPEVPVAHPATTMRVVTVGASETFGLYESSGKEYPAQLQDSLATRLRQGRCGTPAYSSVEVLNTSFPGMTLSTIEQDLRLRVSRLRPDVVVIYPAPVSYLEETLPQRGVPTTTPSPPPSWTRALYPRLLGRARSQVKEMLPDVVKTALRRREAERTVAAHGPGWRYQAMPADRLDLFRSDLLHVVTTAKSIGARPVVVTHANIFVGRASVDEDALQAWQKFYPRATGPMIIAFDSLARQVELDVAEATRADAVDATGAMAAMPRSAFADFVHFTEAGASTMAAVISEGICQSRDTTHE